MSGHITILSDSLERKTVTYPNRYGFTVTGELYCAKDMDKNRKHPALIVGAPYGGVKEQGALCVWQRKIKNSCSGSHMVAKANRGRNLLYQKVSKTADFTLKPAVFLELVT